MAHKKGGGSTRNGRDSKPKMLGVKAYGGEMISAGSLIVRQRGTRIHAGTNVGIRKDHPSRRSTSLQPAAGILTPRKAPSQGGFVVWTAAPTHYTRTP